VTVSRGPPPSKIANLNHGRILSWSSVFTPYLLYALLRKNSSRAQIFIFEKCLEIKGERGRKVKSVVMSALEAKSVK
jgi:hypothetical protein